MDNTEKRLFDLIDRLVGSIDKMRRDMYIIAVVFAIGSLVVTLAQNKVFANVHVPGISIETHATTTTTTPDGGDPLGPVDEESDADVEPDAGASSSLIPTASAATGG
jgi:hypothetical protein